MRYRLVEKKRNRGTPAPRGAKIESKFQSKRGCLQTLQPMFLPQHSNHQAGATSTKNVFPLPYLTTKDKTMELMLFWGRFSVATVAKSHNRWMLQLQKDWESSLRIQDNLGTQSRQGTDMKLPLPNTILSH